MNEHDHQEAAERELSALYRRLKTEGPPSALDNVILRAAREEAEGGKSAFASRAGLSVAASVMLVTLSVLLFGDLEERASDEAVANFAPAASEAGMESARAEGAGLEDGGAQGLAPGPLVEPMEARPQAEFRRNVVIPRTPEGEAPEQQLAEPPATAAAGTNRPPPIARSAGILSDTGVPERTAAAGDRQEARSLEELLQLVEQARLTESQSPRLILDARLAAIKSLLEEGREQEARELLQRVRETYPDMDVEAALGLRSEAAE